MSLTRTSFSDLLNSSRRITGRKLGNSRLSLRRFPFPSAAIGANYIEDVFSTYLYTGNGFGKTIENDIELGTDYPYGWSELHLTGDTLTDTSRFARTLTTNAVTVSTDVKKFGTGSLSFNGNTYLTAGKNFLSDSLDSWELQCWVYWNSTGTSSDMGMICSQYPNSSSGGRMLFGSQSGNLVYRVDGGSIYMTTPVSTGQWYHIVLNWDGTTHRLFKDGVEVDSTVTAPAVYAGSLTVTEIGGNSDLGPAYCLDGYIDDLTITNEQPVYTSNFTAPTSASLLDTAGKSGKGGMVWIKSRAGTNEDNAIYDTVRGVTKQLITNGTFVESTQLTGLTAFSSDGFSVGAFNTVSRLNTTFVSWTFRKQAKFFDVVTYTGNGIAGRTVPHNLGSLPGCIIIKQINGTGPWSVYHRGCTTPNRQRLTLNTEDAASALSTAFWNDTFPTSTEFTLGTSVDVNDNGDTYVAYLFAHNAGGFGDLGTDNVISCGTYLGDNHRSEEIVDIGFEPQWVLIKNITDNVTDWVLVDNMRNMSPTGQKRWLSSNSSGVEETPLLDHVVAVNNGFYFNGPQNDINGPGDTFIYIAIRRGPMKRPMSATSVFLPTITTQNWMDETQLPDAGFVADTLWTKIRNVTATPNTFDRLRGDPALDTATTAAQYNNYIDWGGSQTQPIGDTDTYSTASRPFVWYYFKRYPGFFDVVSYKGTSVNRTVSHNLKVVPELMMVRSTNGGNWAVYANNTNTDYLLLNSTAGTAVGSTYWNNTSPTATVFSLGTSPDVNTSNDYIAYLFASLTGISAVGSYTGTGTTLQINCNFTSGARFVMIKRIDDVGDWYVWDTARGITSGNDPYIALNSSAAENTTNDYIDPYSFGFEISSTAPSEINANGGRFIYLAIA
jgi:hypothetical protein